MIISILTALKMSLENDDIPVNILIVDDRNENIYSLENLESIAYYVGAEKGDKNNFGAGEKTEKLVENRQNKVTIIISE